MRTLVVVGVSLVFLLIAGHGPAVSGEAGLISGCLTNDGNVVRLSLGDVPNRPCSDRQVRMSFGLSGQSGANAERLPLDQRNLPNDRDRNAGAAILRLHFPF